MSFALLYCAEGVAGRIGRDFCQVGWVTGRAGLEAFEHSVKPFKSQKSPG